jgi:hypothetical protein
MTGSRSQRPGRGSIVPVIPGETNEYALTTSGYRGKCWRIGGWLATFTDSAPPLRNLALLVASILPILVSR